MLDVADAMAGAMLLWMDDGIAAGGDGPG